MLFLSIILTSKDPEQLGKKQPELWNQTEA